MTISVLKLLTTAQFHPLSYMSSCHDGMPCHHLVIYSFNHILNSSLWILKWMSKQLWLMVTLLKGLIELFCCQLLERDANDSMSLCGIGKIELMGFFLGHLKRRYQYPLWCWKMAIHNKLNGYWWCGVPTRYDILNESGEVWGLKQPFWWLKDETEIRYVRKVKDEMVVLPKLYQLMVYTFYAWKHEE